MKSHSLETEYVSLCASLKQRMDGSLADMPVVLGFWERWTKEHRLAARTLSSRDVDLLQFQSGDATWTEFLKRRQRMVSTLSQGLKASLQESEKAREELKNLLREHDLGFVTLLQKELEYVKEQMTHAFSVRKTVNAYAQTAQYRGE